MTKFSFRLALATLGFIALPFVAHASECSTVESDCHMVAAADKADSEIRVCERVVLVCSASSSAALSTGVAAVRTGSTRIVARLGTRVVHMAPMRVTARKPALVASR